MEQEPQRNAGRVWPQPINVRAETLFYRPRFRGSVRRHRCIIPASGFYTWQTVPGAKRKQSWYFHSKVASLFGFAGASAHDAEGQTTCLMAPQCPL